MPRLFCVVLMVGTLLAVCPPAYSQTSPFEGGDGDQDSGTAPAYDWQAFVGPPRVVNDGADEGLQFQLGDAENRPGGWNTRPESFANGERDIVSAWYRDELVGQQHWLYVAVELADRPQPGGPIYVAVELNQLAAKSNGFPCRTDGDMQILLTMPGAGPAEVRVDEWNSTSNQDGTQCAAVGVFEQLHVDARAADQAVNSEAAPIQNHLVGSGSIATRRFGEFAVNLTALLDDADRTCWGFSSIWTHSRDHQNPNQSAGDETGRLYDYVAPVALTGVRTCSASGIKFEDSDGDGVQSADEPRRSNVGVFADYDADGTRDDNEPGTMTDDNGYYLINSITQPYSLRETAIADAGDIDWACSFPTSGSMVGTVTGSAGTGLFGCTWGSALSPSDTRTGLDFGNVPTGVLTLRKILVPASDQGSFNLLVDGTVALPNAEHNSSTDVRRLSPGSHTVTESAGDGTNLGEYTTSIVCFGAAGNRLAASPDPASETVAVLPGAPVSCDVTNTRNQPAAPVPAVEIVKHGPETPQEWGAELEYTMTVTNTGRVSFGSVVVTDEGCSTPELDEADRAGGDDSFDPGEVWTYRCTRETEEKTFDDCDPTEVVTNTASVVASNDNNQSPTGESEPVTTTMTCPESPPVVPRPPDPPDPGFPPDTLPPSPLPVPQPTPAPGVSAPDPLIPPSALPVGAILAAESTAPVYIRARISMAGPRACVSRSARLAVLVSRAESVTLSVDGRRVRFIRTAPLAERYRITIPARRLRPGRHTIAATAQFELGSGRDRATVSRTLRVCARAARPRFTG